MLRKLFAAAAGIALALGGPASAASLVGATEGYTYFNRSGADPAAHDADLGACMGYAARMKATDLLGSGRGMLLAMLEDGASSANIEHCMVVRGWRVMRLPDGEGLPLARLKQPELAEKLAGFVGASSAPGVVVRAWANEAMFASTQRTGPARLLKGGSSLSVASLPEAAVKAATDGMKPERPKRYPDYAMPFSRPLKLAALGALDPGAALVVFDIRDTGMTNAVTFVREGPDPTRPAWAVDQQKDTVWIAGGSTFQTKDGARLGAYAVPPGRWRLLTVGGPYSITSFCLGAPGFDVAAGEVVFAGRYSFKEAEFGPNLALDDSRAMLAAWPDLAAKLRPAAYVNGNLGLCEGQNLYALEVKGAPFVPGYAWAGAYGSPAQ